MDGLVEVGEERQKYEKIPGAYCYIHRIFAEMQLTSMALWSQLNLMYKKRSVSEIVI